MLKRNYRRNNKQKRRNVNSTIQYNVLHQQKIKHSAPRHLKLVWIILTKNNEIKTINDRIKLQEIIDAKNFIKILRCTNANQLKKRKRQLL